MTPAPAGGLRSAAFRPAAGAISIQSLDGSVIGHGWGRVWLARGADSAQPRAVGEVGRMTWTPDPPAPILDRTCRVAFFGGPSFLATFDAAFPDATRPSARFRPAGSDGPDRG